MKRTQVSSYLSSYKKMSRWPRQKILDHQLQKLQNLVNYAYMNVPYYRHALESKGIKPEDVRQKSDLLHLPILERQHVQDHEQELMSRETKNLQIVKASSSGTTGIPVTYYKDQYSLSSGEAALYALMMLSGWRFGEPTLHIWGNPTSQRYWNTRKSRLKQKLFRRKYVASTLFNKDEDIAKLFGELVSFQAAYVDGYTNSIYQLAQYIKQKELDFPRCQGVFPTAENLLGFQKEAIEKYIGPVSDIYGCGEINGVAAQPIGSTRYYIFDPHVIVEVEQSDDTDYGQLLITDLDNRVMPFIRYRVGDLADNIYEPDENDSIPFSYFNKLFGRTAEVIQLRNGRRILPVNLVGGTLFRKIGGIVKHRVQWDGSQLYFLFQTTRDFNLEAAKSRVGAELHEYGVKFHIQCVDILEPGKNGKMTYFEDISKK